MDGWYTRRNEHFPWLIFNQLLFSCWCFVAARRLRKVIQWIQFWAWDRGWMCLRNSTSNKVAPRHMLKLTWTQRTSASEVKKIMQFFRIQIIDKILRSSSHTALPSLSVWCGSDGEIGSKILWKTHFPPIITLSCVHSSFALKPHQTESTSLSTESRTFRAREEAKKSN